MPSAAAPISNSRCRSAAIAPVETRWKNEMKNAPQPSANALQRHRASWRESRFSALVFSLVPEKNGAASRLLHADC
jgi:hypothetical protein